MQCYHYMAVTGKRSWYIAAVILGREFTYRKLEWDEELIDRLISIEENFWNNHVVKGTIPPPDGSKVCDEVIQQYFHTARKASAIKLVGFDEKLRRREEILGFISGLQEEQKQIEQEVKLFMQDNEYADSEHFRVSWKNVDSTKLDTTIPSDAIAKRCRCSTRSKYKICYKNVKISFFRCGINLRKCHFFIGYLDYNDYFRIIKGI